MKNYLIEIRKDSDNHKFVVKRTPLDYPKHIYEGIFCRSNWCEYSNSIAYEEALETLIDDMVARKLDKIRDLNYEIDELESLK